MSSKPHGRRSTGSCTDWPRRGYLRIAEDGRYTLGPAISGLLMRQSPLDQHVRSAMEELNLEFDEAVALVTIAGNSIVNIDVIESSKAAR